MKHNISVCISTLILATAISLSAQTNLYSSLSGKVSLEVKFNAGDTDIKRTVKSAVINGTMEVKSDELFHKQPGKINAKATVQIPISSLKSKSESLDALMQEHMSYDKYPMINYTLVELSTFKGTNDGSVPCVFKGNLAISGVTNNVSMLGAITKEGNDRLRILVNIDLKMTSFGVEPPRMLGQPPRRWGDDVHVSVEWLVGKNK